MLDDETKNKFIILRAEGKSYTVISKSLNISKSTCSQWESELRDKIAEIKSDNLNKLYNAYYMTKEARIKKLGSTLNKINKATDDINYTELPPDKLLDFKLKYTQALKDEYIPLKENTTAITTGSNFIAANSAAPEAQEITPQFILSNYQELYQGVKTGEINQAQADRLNSILSNLLKAYETTELQERLEALESITGVREND